MVYGALFGALVTSAALPFAWKAPSPAEWAWMAAIGGCAACSHYLIIRAYERAPAAVLAPFNYAEIVVATMLGYLVFSEFPDALTCLGIAIIVASTVPGGTGRPESSDLAKSMPPISA